MPQLCTQGHLSQHEIDIAMKKNLWNTWVNFALVLSSLLAPSFAKASTSEAVWHCSRVNDQKQAANDVSTDDFFQLASSGMNRNAIGITLVDLMDAYTSKPIRVNGQPVTACFMPGDTPLSSQALNSLGLKSSSMQLQARKSAIVQSNLYMVTSEAEMMACISKRSPAVGYLDRVVEDEWIVPCF